MEKCKQKTCMQLEFNCLNMNNFKRILGIDNLRIFKSCMQVGQAVRTDTTRDNERQDTREAVRARI